MPWKDSNPHRRNQNPTCYHYTTRQFFAWHRAARLPLPIVLLRVQSYAVFFIRANFFALFFVVFSDVEPEVHYITVLHDVVFAFDREPAGVTHGSFAAEADIIVIFDDFGADETFLEVGVDDACAFGRF